MIPFRQARARLVRAKGHDREAMALRNQRRMLQELRETVRRNEALCERIDQGLAPINRKLTVREELHLALAGVTGDLPSRIKFNRKGA